MKKYEVLIKQHLTWIMCHNIQDQKMYLYIDEHFLQCKDILLGQFWVLQRWVLEDIPTQLAPPYCGAGLLQDRVRDCTPPPQVSEQEAHDPQLVQDPSTGNVRKVFVNKISISLNFKTFSENVFTIINSSYFVFWNEPLWKHEI